MDFADMGDVLRHRKDTAKANHLQVRALSAGTLREWIALQKVTRKRMSNLLLPLRNALSEALADELIEFNPLDRLKLSRILPRETLTTDYEPEPYSVEEPVPLLVSMSGAERAAFQFWAYTGLRPSELIALEWPDVDLQARTVYVHKAVVEGEEKGTKTRAGIRTLPLLPAARQALEDQRQRTEKAEGRVFLNPRTGMDRSVPAAAVAANVQEGEGQLSKSAPDAAHVRKPAAEPGRESGVHRQAAGPQDD